jgi:hypothetical protein
MSKFYISVDAESYPVYDPQGNLYCIAMSLSIAETIVSLLADPPPSVEDYMADVSMLESNQQEWIEYAGELESILDRLGHDYASDGAIEPDEFIMPSTPPMVLGV